MMSLTIIVAILIRGGDLVQGEGMVLNAWENVAVQVPTVKDLVVIKMIKMLKMMIRS